VRFNLGASEKVNIDKRYGRSRTARVNWTRAN